MFDSLSERLQDVFRNIRGQARLTPETVEVALREIRLALLEADVNFKVVKAFIDKVRDAAVDDEVLKSLTPVQHVIRIVRDEMLALFGDTQGGLPDSQTSPRVILLLGLQGSGKTTTSAQAGTMAHPSGAAPDHGVDRRAASRGHQAARRCSASRRRFASTIPRAISTRSRARAARVAAAKTLGFDTVIVDTAGRLHIDDELDGGADGDQGRRAAGRPAVRRRRDDGAGRDQERG